MTESGDETIRLGGRYELGGPLGRGGMADVRVGRDLRLGRTVAVKQLRGDLAADDTFQARFRREAQSSAALNHPSIVAVYDTGESIDKHGSHVPYIVMEYVEGQTLRDILRGAENGRKILPERALSITADVLSAIDYSHRSGIIHRDIKPANVMRTPSGDVKVVDFGIARADSDASSTLTQTAAVVGTAQSTPERPPYAWFVSFAPEKDPKVAVAVLVESSDTARDEIAGGRLAGPIAKSVMEAVLGK